MRCSKSPLGSSECEDAAGSVRDWVNTTRNTCCAHRTDPACAWAKSALNDNTCASFTSFKRALLKEVQERLVPVVIIIIILVIIQVSTPHTSMHSTLTSVLTALVFAAVHPPFRPPLHSW